jgi:gluconokinase
VNCFIGIDIGTTHTKSVVVTEHGDKVFELKEEYDILQPQPGYEEQDVSVILSAVEKVMRETFLQNKYSVKAVCFSAAMHSILPVDQEGNPLYHAVIWADTRSKIETEYFAGLPQANHIVANTGVPLHPMLPLSKIVWFRNNRPDIFSQAAKFISIKEYVLFRLFGKYIVDQSVASATGLFNTHQKQWDEEALYLAGISSDLLSVPMSPLHIEYDLAPRYKELFQLKDQTAFVIGGSDGCLANIGSGAVLHGETALTIGTSGAVRTTLHNPAVTNDQTLFTYILAGDIYIRGGAINNGGIVLKWLDELLYDEKDFDAASILRAAETVEPGAGGLLFLPYLLGERAPVWDARARGALVGLTMHHKKEHIARASIEGICFVLNQLIRSLEERSGIAIKDIFISGGFIQSSFWVQLLADITGKRLHVTASADASALGAAFMGMFATGHLNSFAEIKKYIHLVSLYKPEAKKLEAYKEISALFDTIYPKLKESFSALSRLNKN